MTAEPPRRRAPPRRVDGILLVDKPAGATSNAVLQQAKRLFRAAKAGHAGTLDPLATGLLPVCFGEATKFVQSLLDARKRYRATVRFGTATTTGDAEGAVVCEAPFAFDAAALERALRGLTGTIAQLPPLYSALKRDGRPYYAYARAGLDVDRVPREVTIHALSLVDWSPPDAVVDVDCSKGTYVRVLAEDLGAALGSCAHLAALRRTGTAGFRVEDAVDLDTLAVMDERERDARLLPVDASLAVLPRVDLDPVQQRALAHGRRLAWDAAPGAYRAYGEGRFLGVVEVQEGELRPGRLVRSDAG